MKLRVSWWRRLPAALRVALGVLGGLAFLFLLGLGRLAWAGDSGGSFGGSSFGGGGSGGSGDGAWIEIVFYIIYYGFRLLLLSPTAFCIVLGIVILIVVLSRKKGGADAKLTAAGTHIATGGQPWVVMVQLALPASGLRVRSELAAMARSGKTGSRAGMAELLAATCAALLKVSETARYAALIELGPQRTLGDLEKTFQQRASEERARYRRDTVRAEQGRIVTDQKDRLTNETSSGYVVVSVIVALGRKLGAGPPTDATKLAELLGSLRAVASAATVYALEVVWTPAAQGDVLKEEELLPTFPALAGVDGAQASALKCSFCGQPYEASRKVCPSCGGANTGAIE